MTKNPFDLALYTMLLHRLKPATIIEIGSQDGGSGLWLFDQSRALGLRTEVFSFDINPVHGSLESSGVDFRFGDANDLAQSDLPTILDKALHPLLVIEDGPHTYEACLASLQFFEPYLRSGDYYVVEDGILKDLGYRGLRNGPNRAIDSFMRTSKSFVIDRELCDFYGRNVTWNTNGYLRRL